jgi:2-polyprenyl-6-methoxyphenol hydroxylase-like FAD-dependent oxidoreductase
MSEAGQTSHWGIIGGGMLGMTLAHRLTQQGKRVTLIESCREPRALHP